MMRKLLLYFNLMLGFVLVSPSAMAQYCTTNLTNFGCGTDFIANFAMASYTRTLETACTGDYSDMTTDTISVAQGTVNQFTITDGTQYQQSGAIWVDWNNDLDFDDPGEEFILGESLGDNPTTFNASINIPAAAPLGNHRIRIGGGDFPITACYTGTYASIEDYTLNVTAAPTCLQPTTLDALNILATSADLTWTNNSGSADFEVELGAAGFAPVGTATHTGTGALPFNVGSLTASTSYDYYVRSDCGGGDASPWSGPYSFTTTCAVTTPDYMTNFNTFLPSICWEEANGGSPATGPTLGNGSWVSSTTNNPAGSARFNIYSSGSEAWMISPEFDLSAGGYELKVFASISDYNSNTADADGMTGTDDSVSVLMTEDGINWTELHTWKDANQPDLTGVLETMALASTGTNVRFAIYGTDGAIDDTPDYDFHIDSFAIVAAAIPCEVPTALTSANITDVQAELSWTSTVGSYKVEYGATGFAPATGVGTVVNPTSDNPLTVSGLTASTDYDFYVWAICGAGDTSAISAVGSFTSDIVGINESEVSNFAVYPNPNNGQFNIQNSGNAVAGATVQIVDINGKVVYNNKLTLGANSNEIVTMENVVKGMYVLRVVTETTVSNFNFVVK